MKISYDFHIHSALSPCSDDSMSPCNIAAVASLKGLDAIAVTDHNAIANVLAAAEVCAALNIVFIYGVEVQTAEDIHVLAYFDTYATLEAFYKTLRFPDIKNRPEIFGRQLIINSDDVIIGEEGRFLLSSCDEGIYEICKRIIAMGGKAVPAHIDREANGIVAILGEVPQDLQVSALEFSPTASEAQKAKYGEYRRLTDSDSHLPDAICGNKLEAASRTAADVFAAI